MTLMTTELKLTLPYPPTVNHYWGQLGSKKYLGKKGKEFSDLSSNQMVYYHKIGTPQSTDKKIFEDAKHPKRYYGPYVSDDERFLFMDISEGTYGTELWYKDLSNEKSELKI